MTNHPLLTARSLSLERGGRLLCRELNLEIAAGERWGILGPNGAGKSTLLLALAGLERQASGEVTFRGKPLQHWNRKNLARELGVLFQLEEVTLAGTVLESVLTGRHPHLGTFGWETAGDLAIARDAIRAVGLDGLENRDPQTLSGGEHQRMEIATLLTQQPRMSLLDEPTNHLDPGQQIAMLELLQRRLNGAGKASVTVLHDVNLALRFCDHLLLLRGDGDWKSGPAGEIASVELISWLYRHPVHLCHGGDHDYFSFL